MGLFLYLLYNVIVNERHFDRKYLKFSFLTQKLTIIQLKSKQDSRKYQNSENFIQLNCEPSPFWRYVLYTTKMKPTTKIGDIRSQNKSLPT